MLTATVFSALLSVAAADGVKVGDAAPTFEATDDAGKAWKSSDHVGKKIVVVYFYPADFTGGCTKQACGFRDSMADLGKKDVEEIGVSGDSADTHAKFKKEHMLPFTLLADEKGEIARAFGVPFNAKSGTAKTPGGETVTRGGTAQRWTFVIDKSGKVVHVNQKVNAAEDSKAILKVVEGLK
jgi:peroxiredoxin Q/BCP